MTDVLPFSMSVPAIVFDEGRLAALAGFDILDTPPEEGFDDIVQLASMVCGTPVSLVSLVAGDRQWFKARVGFPHEQTGLDGSVCAHALAEPDMLVIPDLTADARSRNNPLVTDDPNIRFYAGVPLRTPDGHVLGSLCVIDQEPRPDGLTAHQAEVMRNLGRQVMTLLEMRRAISGRDTALARRRRAVQQFQASATRLRISEAHWRGLFERLNEGLVIAELVRDDTDRVVDWRYLDVNAAWGALMGIEPASAIGRTSREVLPGARQEWIDEFARVVDTGEPAVFTRQVGTLSRWYEGRVFPLDDDRFAVLFVEVTDRFQAEMRRNALLEIGDQLRDITDTAEMTRTATSIVGQVLGATRVGFGTLDTDGEHVVIGPDWTAEGMASIAGRHRFSDYGDIRRELLLGEPLIVQDALTDPRIAQDRERWEGSRIRALVNIPIRERGRTVAVFIAHDDQPRAWSPETVAFLRNAADRLVAGVARVRAEEQQEVLNQELSHRMKNMLAMIQAIAMQTLKGVTEQEAVKVFRRRLQALGAAHDVLLQKSWAVAPMRDVVSSVLGRSSQVERFTLDGPELTLGPRATLSLSLLLHELATNAAKYGALSVEAGQVAVAWRLDDSGEVVFTWSEAGGPPAVEPTRKGFGSRLINAGLIGTGGVTLRYMTTGFQAEMRARVDQVQLL